MALHKLSHANLRAVDKTLLLSLLLNTLHFRSTKTHRLKLFSLLQRVWSAIGRSLGIRNAIGHFQTP
jgi:hypothetical protein